METYKREQESKKTRTRPRKQEKKNENKASNKKATKKKRKKKSFFLDRFLGQVLVFFFISCFSCFLIFLFSSINSQLRRHGPSEDRMGRVRRVLSEEISYRDASSLKKTQLVYLKTRSLSPTHCSSPDD